MCYHGTMKKIIIFLTIVIAFIIFFVISKQKDVLTNTQIEEPSSLCYYNETLTESGFVDRSWLRLNFSGEKVSGEYHNLPAEKDSKVGNFEGVYVKDELGVTSRADLVWQAEAEGMTVSEQLLVNFTTSEAFVAFGEMKEGNDGMYVYSNPASISYWQTLPSTTCEDLDERILVEKYIRENIQTLISQETVLGGTWYVVSAVVDPLQNSVVVTSEDGHIQDISDFSYTVENGLVTILN